MQPLLILKLGDTFPDLVRDHGDFEHLILAQLAEHVPTVTVLDPRREPLPDARRFSGIVLTGSHAMVTQRQPWSELTAEWLPSAVAAEVPLLGICYGHQLIAHAFGGEVGLKPAGKEFGTVPIHLEQAAHGDLLFDGLPPVFSAHTSHSQFVLRLPPDAVRLAFSERDPHSAYRLNASAWGVQFHPEYDMHTVRTYITECAAELRAEGIDPDALARQTSDTPHARELLARFAKLCRGV
jgi:GMP synthase (glutamine-hydrolysing)